MNTHTVPEGPSRPSVLLVEDDTDQVALITRWLEGAGDYDINVAHDGTAANRVLWSRPWSLVISDIQLPGLDGLSLLSRFRAADRTTPFVLISSRNTLDDAHKALKLQATDFLPKPLDRSAFLDCATTLARIPCTPAAVQRDATGLAQVTRAMADTLAGSMTLVAGVADLLMATAGPATLDRETAARYAGMVDHAVGGMLGVLADLNRLRVAAEGEAYRADICAVAKQAVYTALPRLAVNFVTVKDRIPQMALMVRISGPALRGILTSALLLVAENASIYHVHGVEVYVSPVDRTTCVDVRVLSDKTRPDLPTGLQEVLSVVASEAILLGVRCLVDCAPGCLRLRFTAHSLP